MLRNGNRAGPHQLVSGHRYLVGTLLAFVLTAVVAAPVTAITHPSFADSPSVPGLSGLITEVHAVTVDGVRRTYRSITSVQAPSRVPLLIVLHGRGQSSSVAARQTGFLGLAEQRRAVLVFPDGEQRSWDAGHGCCGAAGSRRAPDVSFVAAIVSDAVRRWPVDVERVYLVGYSNGGKLAYSAVCAHSTLFAAVATYGAVPLAPCPPGTLPVPFLLAAGTADPVLPFHGKPGGHPPLPAVPQAVDWLRAQDGCPAREQTGRDGPVVVQRWADCADGADVESVIYPGWGHAWPVAGANGRSPAAATLMWTFLSWHDARTIPPAASAEVPAHFRVLHPPS
jgi:polyhydroxybutyrate depolymerase